MEFEEALIDFDVDGVDIVLGFLDSLSDSVKSDEESSLRLP